MSITCACASTSFYKYALFLHVVTSFCVCVCESGVIRRVGSRLVARSWVSFIELGNKLEKTLNASEGRESRREKRKTEREHRARGSERDGFKTRVTNTCIYTYLAHIFIINHDLPSALSHYRIENRRRRVFRIFFRCSIHFNTSMANLNLKWC
jgi:hypothetical protein